MVRIALLIGVAAILIILGWWYLSDRHAPVSSGTTQLPVLQNITTSTREAPEARAQEATEPITQKEPQKTLDLTVYFSKENDSSDPAGVRCAHAIKRTVPYTTGVARAALTELFKGPFVSEKQQGYYSCIISTDITIRNIEIKDGIAFVDLSKEYTDGCGGASTCSQAARNAITNTLLQFPTIKKVEILIEGVPEGRDA